MTDVLDISAYSPYSSAPQQDDHHDARSASESTHSLNEKGGRRGRGDSEDMGMGGEVTWHATEPTLSRGTGAAINKEDEGVQRDSTTTEAGDSDDKGRDPEKPWHPLQAPGHGQDATVVVDLDLDMGKLSPATSGLKSGPSPPPWEVIQPPSDNGHRAYGGGSKVIRKSPSKRLIPKSSYYFGPPPADAAFGSLPVGQIGVHHPREIIRIERDYTGGELTQFAPIYPLELEGRITPTQFLESVNAINERLIEAHSLRMAMLDNLLAVATLYLSRLVVESHYDKEMRRLRALFDELNTALFNPAGLNLLWPADIAFLFLEIEYY